MFEPQSEPRVFGCPPGADFPAEVVERILTKSAPLDPGALARCTIFVNTARMQRRMVELFSAAGSRLLPRIRLIPDLARDPVLGTGTASPALRRRLELAQLVRGLIASEPGIAPGSAAFDLADSLAALVDEMEGEGVGFDRLRTLDVAGHSAHWARNLRFLSVVEGFTQDRGETYQEARQRAAVLALVRLWQTRTPTDPVILAGSTGSRGATSLLMQAVARLDHGTVILPGFDPWLPAQVWQSLVQSPTQDHPQFRFARFLNDLDLSPNRVKLMGTAPAPERNRMLSLALRPAPITDSWLSEGSDLGPLPPACAGITLIEAPEPRSEALAIACRLRQAVSDGKRAALITPDRTLGRMVTAALDRWGILPDDSGGTPLNLSAPGRFLRQVAGLSGQRLTSIALLALLKHPLCHTGGPGRGDHLRLTRDLELSIRRNGPAFPTPASMHAWADGRRSDERRAWATWVAGCIDGLDQIGPAALADHLSRLETQAHAWAAGPGLEGSGALWDQDAGLAARATLDALFAEAEAGGTLTPREFSDLVRLSLSQGEVRSAVAGHPQVAIWGTLEARVQGADLVILGGLNDGVWPGLPDPDPWLSRGMRAEAGLCPPDRTIGLAAHDFQQAAAAAEVVLSRSKRDAQAETVPSRWLNRLINLLNGLPGRAGPQALKAMRERGEALLDLARTLDAPRDMHKAPPASRPAPRPPAEQRPRHLSVTQIQKLVRDPYAIYAREVLGLRALDPLHPDPDARLKGVVVHDILERFVRDGTDPTSAGEFERLMSLAGSMMEQAVPWPSTRLLWLARFRRAAEWFARSEISRRDAGTPVVIEDKVTLDIPDLGFALTARADRIDRHDDGSVTVFDYKTGAPPKDKVMRLFDKQLWLEAAMVERGAFASLGPAEVRQVAHISVGSDPLERAHSNADDTSGEVWARFLDLIEAYRSEAQGYAARRAVQDLSHSGEYDHLSRYGEWDDTTDPSPGDVGR